MINRVELINELRQKKTELSRLENEMDGLYRVIDNYEYIMSTIAKNDKELIQIARDNANEATRQQLELITRLAPLRNCIEALEALIAYY